MPIGIDYRLDSIDLRLGAYATTLGDVALIQIYADAARTSTSPLTATLQSVLFNNPTSSSNGNANYTFTPTSTFTFAANTRYWLLVDRTAGDFNWNSNNPNITPTGGSGITFNSYQLSTDNGGSYFGNPNSNSFNINATAVAVPFEFEATGGLAILGAGWLLRRHFKNKKL